MRQTKTLLHCGVISDGLTRLGPSRYARTPAQTIAATSRRLTIVGVAVCDFYYGVATRALWMSGARCAGHCDGGIRGRLERTACRWPSRTRLIPSGHDAGSGSCRTGLVSGHPPSVPLASLCAGTRIR